MYKISGGSFVDGVLELNYRVSLCGIMLRSRQACSCSKRYLEVICRAAAIAEFQPLAQHGMQRSMVFLAQQHNSVRE